jgi:uncharacterized protein YpmB
MIKKLRKLKWVIVVAVLVMAVAVGIFYIMKQHSTPENVEVKSPNTTKSTSDETGRETVIK